MIRFGLCCIFRKEPIKYRRTTAKYLKKTGRHKQLKHLSTLCRHNATSLLQSLQFCRQHGIGDFRVNSQILPLKTHPDVGYHIEALPESRSIIDAFRQCGQFCRQNSLRTTFHPDQFILLSSPDPKDFPECWLNLNVTVEVEAKAKELAVLKLKKDVEKLHLNGN